MAGLLLGLSMISGTYEMLFLMIGFREYVTWRIGVIWVLAITMGCIGANTATMLWPQVPLVFFWIIPIVIINTIMSSRLLYTQWLLMLPVAIFLNAIKRLLGALVGVVAKIVANSTSPMLLRQAVGLQSAADWNLFIAVVITLPIVVLLGLVAHRWLVRVAAADFLQRARVDLSDYLLVLLFFVIYVMAYVFAMEWSINGQAYMAIVASMTFGIIGVYLINNKNSHLNDTQLLLEVSNYNELLSHHNQDLHLFKHDYQNVLLSMEAFIQMDDMPGLKHYFDTEVMPASRQLDQQTELAGLSRLEVPTVSGMIYAKYEAAAHQDIQVSVTILETVQLTDVPQIRVVRILGNLLDNAIDAAARADRQVTITINNRDVKTVVFSIVNQVPAQETLDLSVIRKSRFTTKPGHLGYGLSSIEQLVTAELQVNYRIQDDHFIAELIVQH